MNKKGINEVVVVVLIVLLSLVAITLVWVFVRTSINTTGEQVDKGLIFQTVRFSIIPNTVDTSGGNINFTLERNAGAGKISGFLIVLEDQTGNSSIVRTYERTAMEELGRIKVSILKTTHGLSGNVTKISVFPTVVDSGGELISSDSPSTQYTIPTSGIQKPCVPTSGSSQFYDQCGNGIDDNCDGRVDEIYQENLACGDGKNNDCVGGADDNIPTIENNCVDIIDDDCDGDFDMDDSDCSNLLSCGMNLNQAGRRYVLNSFNAPSGFSGNCLSITANNIVLEATSPGVGISGSSYRGKGIYVSPGVTNFTLINVSVSSFGYGVYINDSSDNKILGSFLNDNNYSLYIAGNSNNNNVTNNEICFALEQDISCTGSGTNNFGTGNSADTNSCSGISVSASC